MFRLDSLAYRALLRSAARSTLLDRPRSRIHVDRGRFTDADVRDLLHTVWRFERAMPAPPGSSFRTTVSLRLAGFALAFRDALLLREVERDHANDLVADLIWKVTRRWARIGRRMLRGAPRWPRSYRAEPAPFSPCPAAVELRPVAPGGYEVAACPVADFLKAHDADDLCRRVWCDAVYPISDRAGLTLQRSATIADGAPCCRMRWRR